MGLGILSSGGQDGGMSYINRPSWLFCSTVTSRRRVQVHWRSGAVAAALREWEKTINKQT